MTDEEWQEIFDMQESRITRAVHDRKITDAALKKTTMLMWWEFFIIITLLGVFLA